MSRPSSAQYRQQRISVERSGRVRLAEECRPRRRAHSHTADSSTKHDNSFTMSARAIFRLLNLHCAAIMRVQADFVTE